MVVGMTRMSSLLFVIAVVLWWWYGLGHGNLSKVLPRVEVVWVTRLLWGLDENFQPDFVLYSYYLFKPHLSELLWCNGLTHQVLTVFGSEQKLRVRLPNLNKF